MQPLRGWALPLRAVITASVRRQPHVNSRLPGPPKNHYHYDNGRTTSELCEADINDDIASCGLNV